jgi:cobalt-zinc-cadmium efflux system outer membrane protein
VKASLIIAVIAILPAKFATGEGPETVELRLPETHALPTEALPPLGAPPPVAAPEKMTLESLVQLAYGNNPSIAQAEARIQANRGRWLQSGLPLNPEVGYLATEIGNDGKAGQQGGFVSKEFVTGHKLQLSRDVASQEIQQSEQQLAAVQRRARTDVGKAYYAALLAQRRIELAKELLGISNQAVEISKRLRKAEEIPTAGLLQSEMEQLNANVVSQTAQNRWDSAWRRLAAVVGAPLPSLTLEGDVSTIPAAVNWNEELQRLTSSSPEVLSASANVARARAALRRACAEPIPNLSTMLSVQYDNSTNDTITGVQIGVPLPIVNRNQGGIRQAQAEVTEAQRNVMRVERDLEQRLAVAVEQYSSARVQAETYASTILPKSRQTFELVQKGYSSGELGYLELLTAQRTYFQTNFAYLDALDTVWAQWLEIDGLLLGDSLKAPSQ